MAITIDWSTKVISVPKADLTLIQSEPTEIRELNINNFHSWLRNEEDSETGIPFLPTHNHIAPISIGELTLARVVEIINGYTVTFEDAQYAVNIKGGNSNIAENTNVNQVSVRPFNSAGLVTSAGIEAIEYERAVWIDVTSPYNGTLYPIGTFRRPVNNLADAKLIAQVRGFSIIHIIGNITFGATDNIDDFLIIGQSDLATTVTVTSGCSTVNSEFGDVTLTGTLSGVVELRNCTINTISGFVGQAHNCSLTGNISLGGTSSDLVNFIDCHLGTAYIGLVVIDMNGNGPHLGMRAYVGGVKITNKSGASKVAIDFISGRIEITNTVTAGTFFIRGIGEITDNQATGITLHNNSLVNPATIASQEGNLSYEFVEATIENAIRKVAIGVLDHMIIKTKKDSDPDWSSPIDTKTLYYWYGTLGDTNPIKVAESD